VPYPTDPDPVTVARSDSEVVLLAAFFCAITITAAASVAAAFGANTESSAAAVITSPLLRIEVVVDAEGVVSPAATLIVQEIEGPLDGRVVRIVATYVPATVGAAKVTVNFAVTYPAVLTVELTFAVKLSPATTTVAVFVSSNVSVADLLAVEGCVNIADNTVAVSADVSEIYDNETTAVAVSPTRIESVAESIVKVGAITVACVGSADNTPKDMAAASPRAIFLNEFIILLVYLYYV
jgi:hypothetical protein